VIIDLAHFMARGQGRWQEFERFLNRFEAEPNLRLSLDEIKRFHYLYEEISADLVKIGTFSAEPQMRDYLESLVARAYGQMHENRRFKRTAWSLRKLLVRFPQTVRRHGRALILAVVVFLAGAAFGGLAVALDDRAKPVIMPWPHLLQNPSERVAKEESDQGDSLDGNKTSFSAQLMTHNTRVSVLSMASGMTYGIGTVILTFYNGVILGGVVVDYVLAGETAFVAGWLLPHGSIEIPAILIAVQAGFVLAGALLGDPRTGRPLGKRLRAVRPDLVTLIAGVALMLVWAGLVEAFLSQYHAPVLPYSVKIAWGIGQLLVLLLFLIYGGRGPSIGKQA